MNKITCKLDPFCTSIIMQYPQYFIRFYVYIINLCFSDYDNDNENNFIKHKDSL